ncbi:MAG TPA: PSD1 and planctomycete cytochrome C domain-containing protein [Planctomycetota bacterium]|nr:PSD1 and planctomycete cytochrome C domain-containing protein [Planctomycetota bacterium]
MHILASKTAFVLSLLCLTLSRSVHADGNSEEFFEKRVRPIFSEHCFSCHSLSAGKDKGGLRMDSREALLAGGNTGPAIEPGKPEASLIVKAIRRTDPDLSMPPKKPPMPEGAIQDIERWIREGAAYPARLSAVKKNPAETHWAFQPVKPQPVPAVRDAKWARTDIDRFLQARMEAAGLAPGGDAAPHVLARRMYLLLTGLPPKPEELDAFLQAYAQNRESATQQLTEKLLASPAFGERWARHWMDVVRYADSKGHENDYEIEGAWQYRDYVIRALNADLPYDRFLREHIAGDLLPARLDPASGRNEAVLATAWWNFGETGFSPLDVAVEESDLLDNQIEVFGKTFNALTIGCARCHDHKFDPISAREYYGLFGMMKSSRVRRAWSNEVQFEQSAARLRALRDKADAALQPERAGMAFPVPPLELDGSKLMADFSKGIPEGWMLTGHAEVIDEKNAASRGLPHGLWSGTLSRKLPASLRSPSFVIEDEHLHVLVGGQDAMVQVIIANHQTIREPIYGGLKHRVGSGNMGMRWHRFSIGRWKGLTAHVEIFTGTVDDQLRLFKTNDSPHNQFGIRAVILNNGKVPPAPPGVCESGMPRLAPPPEIAAEIAAIEKQIPAPERYLALADINGSDVPIYARGDARKPREGTVPRKYLDVCGGGSTPKSGSGRLELAESLLSTKNPLTSRVIVNRVWHYLYGRGIVPSVDNFGVLGDAPSHPELLDFLATRFVTEYRWSMKRLIREIVLSRSWQLAGGSAPAADADNKLLSRFPLRRLEAEAIRDSIFAVAGTLDPKIGGPSIFTPHRFKGTLTNGVDPPSGPIDGQRRRSLYLTVWRNYPYTFMDVFDKPPPMNTFGKRDISNVPAQALALLNEPFIAEQAKAWGQRISKLELSSSQRVERMYREAFSRPPSEREAQQALELVGQEKTGWEDLALALFNLKEFIYVN